MHVSDLEDVQTTEYSMPDIYLIGRECEHGLEIVKITRSDLVPPLFYHGS